MTTIRHSQINDKDTLAILSILKSRASEWKSHSLEHVLRQHVVNKFDYSLEVITSRVKELQAEYHRRHRNKESHWQWYQKLQELDEALAAEDQEANGRTAKRRRKDRFLEEDIELFMDYWREEAHTIDPTTKRITELYLEEKQKQKNHSNYESTWIWFDVIDKFIRKNNIDMSDFEQKREIEKNNDWQHQTTRTAMARGITYIEHWAAVAREFLREEADRSQRNSCRVRKSIEGKQRDFAEMITRDSGLI
ncbi:hypothetical protein BX666DRAFT_1658819 [Dichotomocladium elegans]|nr:hypothetical protein BX666DRAFT_1658819 [Dichotomocladium elegans]